MIRKIVLLLVLAAACPHVMAAVFSGVVVDEGGEPLAGASLRSAECNVAAVTDINGAFRFACDARAVKVRVSYVGYVAETFVLKDGADSRLVLRPDQTSLNEVVVTATRTPKTLKDVPVVTRSSTRRTSARSTPPISRTSSPRKSPASSSATP